MTIDFFISYAREDAAAARALLTRLTANGWSVWMDEKDIPPSVPWMTEIQRAIDESMMVVAIESSDWLSSEACHIEVGLAEQGRVPVLRVNPDQGDADDQLSEVVRAYRSLPSWRAVSLAAAASAAIWDAAGRKRSLLSRGRPLVTMRQQIAAHPDDFSPAATAFVRASSRDAARRLVTGLVLGLVVPILLVTTATTITFAQQENQKATKAIAASTAFAQRNAYYRWNTYAGLERAASNVSGDFSQYRELFEDLTDRTPTSWSATPATTSGPLAATSPVGRMMATAHGSDILITASGSAGTKRLTASAPVTAIAWAPNGRWIAAATTGGANVLSVTNGQVIPLRGGIGNATSVRWVDDQRVSVGGTEGTGVWPVLDGRATAAVGSIRFGTEVDGRLYTVDTAGAVTGTDVATGASTRLAAAAPAGSTPSGMASSSGEVVVSFGGSHPFVEVIDLRSGTARDVPTTGCTPAGLSVTSDGRTSYLACFEPNVNETRVDLRTGSLTSRPFQRQEAYGVRVLGDRVVWGGVFGGVFQSSLTLAPEGTLTTAAGCGSPTRGFAAEPDASAVFPIGDGTTTLGCAARIEVEPQTRVDRLIFNSGDADAVPAADISRDGSLIAYGLSDGQVRVFTTGQFDPIYFAQVLPGQIRTISFSADGKSLVVGDVDGQIVTVRLPFTSAAVGAKAMPAEGLSRLKHAIAWGIYTSTRKG